MVKEEICILRTKLVETRAELKRNKRQAKSINLEASDYFTEEEKNSCHDVFYNLNKAKIAYRDAKNEFDGFIIMHAAVPPSHYRNTKVVIVAKTHTGQPAINIYFGGKGRPDGPGHRHYVLSMDGDFLYHEEYCKDRKSQKNRIKKWSRPYCSVVRTLKLNCS